MERILKFSNELPPVWYALEKKFGVKWGTVSVTYGDTVYSQDPISEDLKAHEAVHIRQQGNDPAGWWQRYLEDPDFRRTQEIEAYREQFRFIKKNYKDRNQVAKAKYSIAASLAGKTYGSLMTSEQALKELTKSI